MAWSQRHLSQHQPQPQQQQQQQSLPFSRNLDTIDGQISPGFNYFFTGDVPDQSNHPPYVPQFQFIKPGPNPVPATDASDGGVGLSFNFGLELQGKRVKEQDFFENTSQISSVELLQARSVSTGLGLSLDDARIASTGDSALLSLIGNDIDQELQQHDADIDRFLRVQADRLRQNILEKVQSSQLQTVSLIEDRVLQKLREKDAEVESINKKNKELEERMDQLSSEANLWQQQVIYSDNMISALKYNLQQIYAQSNSKEGCGDSEVNDTASCCNGHTMDIHPLGKGTSDMGKMMVCKVCGINEVCMLLLPCKHLCLCKDCERKLSFCPLCQSSKVMGMEVYMQ